MLTAAARNLSIENTPSASPILNSTRLLASSAIREELIRRRNATTAANIKT